MLIIEPTHGLCNRLRVIRSGINLALKYNLKLHIIWRVNSELGCRFEDLFQTSKFFTIQNVEGTFGKIYCRAKKMLSDVVIGQKEIIEYELNDDKMDEYLEKHGLSDNKKIYIKTYDEFYTQSTYVTYEWLKPVCKIEKTIEQILNPIGNKGIGVHIRRTDNIASINASPLELFSNMIGRELANDEKAKFFIASDDIEVKEFLQKKFGTCIYTNMESVLNRDSRKGMESSVVDLFVLSRMKRIYGSYWSSFSEEAAKVGGVELIILHTNYN